MTLPRTVDVVAGDGTVLKTYRVRKVHQQWFTAADEAEAYAEIRYEAEEIVIAVGTRRKPKPPQQIQFILLHELGHAVDAEFEEQRVDCLAATLQRNHFVKEPH